MPNLNHLKKQAKLILRWHRNRYYPVATQIRETLPRFQHLSDSEILDCSFRLGDAQELVAKQLGFESWQALKRGHFTMSRQELPTVTRPVITAAEPQLFVTDVRTSCDFFTQKLGFKIAFVYGDPPFFGQVMRDGARLNLRYVGAPIIDPTLRDREELLSATMTVESTGEIKQLFLEFQAMGVQFHQTLKKQPWGARNFIVKDPDGNLLLFAGRTD
jgi:uncharacterized glyoxalase superfamily protein PhnB